MNVLTNDMFLTTFVQTRVLECSGALINIRQQHSVACCMHVFYAFSVLQTTRGIRGGETWCVCVCVCWCMCVWWEEGVSTFQIDLSLRVGSTEVISQISTE